MTSIYSSGNALLPSTPRRRRCWKEEVEEEGFSLSSLHHHTNHPSSSLSPLEWVGWGRGGGGGWVLKRKKSRGGGGGKGT